MEILVSQLPYVGSRLGSMAALPSEFGIEVFLEYEHDFFWMNRLDEVMKERKGTLSIHGPYLSMDLASRDCDWVNVVKTYRWVFEYCQKYHAVHCVLHPHGEIPDDCSRKDAQMMVFDRVAYLAEMAKQYGVQLLVENMPYRDLLFEQEDFMGIFPRLDTVDFIIDTGHALLHRWDMEKLLKGLGSRIKAYHINDNTGETDEHLKVGEGILEWEKFFSYVKRFTPDARLVLEYLTGPIDTIVSSIEMIRNMLV